MLDEIWIKQFEKSTYRVYQTVTIADSETDSPIVDTSDYIITSISADSAFDGTALTMKAGHDAAALLALNDNNGSARSIAIAASKIVEVNPNVSLRWPRYIQFIADSQTGDTVLTIYGLKVG